MSAPTPQDAAPIQPAQADCIRRNLRYWRLERRLTVRALAGLIGLRSHTGIVDMERGRRTITVAQLTALAEALQVPVSAFYEEPPTRLTGALEDPT